MTMTESHEVRDAVMPTKIVSEPGVGARSITLDGPICTTSCIDIDALDEVTSGLSNDVFGYAQDGDDSSLVDGPLCFILLAYIIESS